MGIGKRKLLLNVFFKAQLNYCPLIWVLDGRYNNNNNNIQYTKYACDLSTMRNALHAINVQKKMEQFQNIQELAIKTIKAKNALAPEIEFLWSQMKTIMVFETDVISDDL